MKTEPKKYPNIEYWLNNRHQQPRTLWGWEWKTYRAAITWGVLLGTLAALVLLRTLKDAQKASLKPVGQTIFPKVEIVEAAETPRCYDPIVCIRDIGEELGVSNQDIMTMIRIAKAESTLNPRAKNPKSSASGLFQIIAGTWYSNDCVGDKWDFEDNIRCAYKIYQRRGFQPWNASRAKWNR